MNLRSFLVETQMAQVELAKRISAAAGRELSPSLLSQWINGIRPIAARWAIPIERATGGDCPRHELRPDIYPPPESVAA